MADHISTDLLELAKKVSDLETENRVLKEMNSAHCAKILDLQNTIAELSQKPSNADKPPLLG
jgi:hypothetical protein